MRLSTDPTTTAAASKVVSETFSERARGEEDNEGIEDEDEDEDEEEVDFVDLVVVEPAVTASAEEEAGVGPSLMRDDTILVKKASFRTKPPSPVPPIAPSPVGRSNTLWRISFSEAEDDEEEEEEEEEDEDEDEDDLVLPLGTNPKAGGCISPSALSLAPSSASVDLLVS